MGWRGAPLGLLGGSSIGGGPPWGTTVVPLIPCVLFFPAPFFWVVNVSVTKFSDCRSPSVSVAIKKLQPQLKAVSLRRNMLIYDLDAVYFSGRSSKK